MTTKSTQKPPQLQDSFLQALRQTQTPVSIFLVSGIRLKGTIESFDMHMLTLAANTGSQMVYKHVISTIQPDRQVDYRHASE